MKWLTRPRPAACQQFQHGGELAEQQNAVPPATASVTSSRQASSLALLPVQLSATRRGSQQISRSRISTANTVILSSGFAARSFSRASTTAARYSLRCSVSNSTRRTFSVLGGSSRSTSDFMRRRMKGPVNWFSRRTALASSSCTMGFSNRAQKVL